MARQKKKALIAYYQNPIHTCLRYLSKPNPWLHKNASYVYIDKLGQRWSTFEDYEPLIAMLYLAIIDKEMTHPDGNMEERFFRFVTELAQIGRAHNWDKIRVRDGKKEEYDDLEGDRPSCYSGSKRRYFQSISGHPLFDLLTLEMIDAEIRQFAVIQFKPIFAKIDPIELKRGIEDFYDLEDITKYEKLFKKFDIALEKQEQFKKYLAKKYGSQFNLVFHSHVYQAFSLDPSKVGTKYHLLKLDYLIVLSDLCDSAINEIKEIKKSEDQTNQSVIVKSTNSNETLSALINQPILDRGNLTEFSDPEAQKEKTQTLIPSR